MRGILSTFSRNDDGQAVLETALVIPIILMIVMVGITLSLFTYAQIIVTMSASNGARVGAAIWNDSSITMEEKHQEIKNAALSLVADNLYGKERSYKVNHVDGMLKVTVAYDFKILLPFSDIVFKDNVVVINHTAEIYIGE